MEIKEGACLDRIGWTTDPSSCPGEPMRHIAFSVQYPLCFHVRAEKLITGE